MDDVLTFGLVIGAIAAAGLFALFSSRIGEYLRVPAPALFLVLAAVASDVWPALGNLTRITISARDGNGKWGGRVVKMTLHGSATASLPITGDDFRSRLGLRSTWFNLSVAG